MRITILLLVFLSFNTYTGAEESITDRLSEGLDITSVPFALSGIISVLSVYYATSDEQSLMRYAQPDAASYVASDGELESAYLEKTLITLREKYPNASDMDLAKAILAY